MANLDSDSTVIQELQLNMFTETDWKHYLSRVLGDKAAYYRNKMKKELDGYETLMRHPLLLEMTTEVLPELAEKGKWRRIDIYEIYVDRWAGREAEKRGGDGDLKSHPYLAPETQIKLAEGLAWSMFTHGITHIHYARLEEIASRNLPEIFQRTHNPEFVHNEIRSGSFLIRDRERNEYSFANAAFLYYF